MTEPITATGIETEDWVYLIGRPPASEFLSYVKAQTVGGATRDVAALMDTWRAANDRIRDLERDDAGAADNATVDELPPEMATLAIHVISDPIVVNSFNVVPTTLGLVELDRLVVYQKQINLRYVKELRNQLGETPAHDAVFRLALPFDHPVPQVGIGRTAGNTWVLTSPSADFRFLGGELVDQSQLTGFPMTGSPAAVMAVIVGHGSNYLNAVSAEGRLVLNNGSHRAYALREAGLTHAPCLIQQVTRRDELELLSNELHSNADRYLSASRPPMLKDYFDEHLRQVVTSPRLGTQVTVSFGVQVARVPLR